MALNNLPADLTSTTLEIQQLSARVQAIPGEAAQADPATATQLWAEHTAAQVRIKELHDHKAALKGTQEAQQRSAAIRSLNERLEVLQGQIAEMEAARVKHEQTEADMKEAIRLSQHARHELAQLLAAVEGERDQVVAALHQYGVYPEAR
jgi:chromosome segregation ATPase